VEPPSPSQLGVALRVRITRTVAALLSLYIFVAGTGILVAQGDDPSEVFLKAYLAAQQGEKLEHENRFKTALSKYRFAGSLIETLRRSHGDWQPAIVEYRGRKISEGILRIQERTTRQDALSASSSPLPDVVPALPESGAWSEPGPEVVAPQLGEPIAGISRDAVIEGATKRLRDKVDQLQADLGKARSELETARKEKETIDTRLKVTNSKLEKTENDLKTSLGSQDSNTREQQQLRGEVVHLKDALAAADSARLAAEQQRDETQAKFAKANTQIAALEHERDEALAQMKAAKENEQGVQLLLAEKNDLQQKLANAEEEIRTLSESDPIKADKFDQMNRQLAELQQRLAETEKRNDYLTAKAAELDVQLDDASTQLQAAMLTGANGEESVRLESENELLRNIVVRERQEEARRDQTRNVVLAELDKLKIRSETLNSQIEFLAQPVTKLSGEELALFRQPVVSVSDQNAGLFKASFVFEKKSAPNSISSSKTDENGGTGGEGDTRTNRSEPSKTGVPLKIQRLVGAARKNFQQGNFKAAEKQYQQILSDDPGNVDALSNLGAIYVRSGKLSSAESTLKQAVAIAPDNDFLLTTLGVVQYRQSKFDDAIVQLNKAIEINPKSATAHNYLGIAASQKGRQKEAEKEILQALANNPDDADAHFNLAVILITTQPGSKELARQHYARATALGTQPSPSLEKLLR
jgi:Flp pilus assembly protein TadD